MILSLSRLVMVVERVKQSQSMCRSIIYIKGKIVVWFNMIANYKLFEWLRLSYV